MKTDKYKLVETFHGEDGDTLSIRYTNRGDPFSEGVELSFRCEGTEQRVYLETWEAKRLNELIAKLLDRTTP